MNVVVVMLPKNEIYQFAIRLDSGGTRHVPNVENDYKEENIRIILFVLKYKQ